MQPDIPSGFTTMLAAMVALGRESTTGQMMRTFMAASRLERETLDGSRQKAGRRVANPARAVALSLRAEEPSKTFLWPRLLVHGMLPPAVDAALNGGQCSETCSIDARGSPAIRPQREREAEAGRGDAHVRDIDRSMGPLSLTTTTLSQGSSTTALLVNSPSI
jgi:hypothetical protein